MVLAFVKKFESNQVFTEEEGWLLFKISAVAEACGWSMLIFGIAWEQYIMPGNHVPVMIAGRVHGVLFLIYALTAIGLYPTLRWSRKRAFVALMASAPPFGSLLFEQWAQWDRRNHEANNFSYNLVYFQVTQIIAASGK